MRDMLIKAWDRRAPEPIRRINVLTSAAYLSVIMALVGFILYLIIAH